jgi:glycosyltransferase involved in cell wall biosynthesis
MSNAYKTDNGDTMLTVVHISAGRLDMPGGIREVIRHLVPAQQKSGIEPVVVGLCQDREKTGLSSQIAQHWISPSRFTWLERYRLYRRVVQIVRQASTPVIVHAHELRGSGEIALKIRDRLDVRFLVTIHIDPAHRHSEQAGSAMNRRNRRAQIAKSADGLAAVSDFIRRKTDILVPESSVPRQIRKTVYPAVTVPTLEGIERRKDMDRPYVLALGRLAEVKGFDSLIRAWAKTKVRK